MNYEDESDRMLKRKRMRKRRKKKRLLIIELAVLAVLATAAYLVAGGGTNQKGYWTIAIFGVDSRDGSLEKGTLSDVEMICNINKATGEIRLVSVYRDTYLKINGRGTYHKINEAYLKGGHKQAAEALNENLDLKIDDYATFNWKSVAEAVNILGGVDIDITDAEFSYINSFITETVNSTGIGSRQLKNAGMNHLDGVQAVAYARLRLMDTDFNRTKRQRRVVELALRKAKKTNLRTLKTLVTTVFPQISTSIGISDLLTIVKGITKYHIGETAGFPFSKTTMKMGRMDCVIATTLESNVIQLHRFLYNDENYSPSFAVKSISAKISKESGISEAGKDAPTDGGEKNKGSKGTSASPKETVPRETARVTEATTEATAKEPEESTEKTTAETAQEETTTKERAGAETNGDGSLVGPGAGLDGPEKEEKRTAKKTKAPKPAAPESVKTPETGEQN